MKLLKINPQNPDTKLLNKAADVVLNNGVIGYPTETIYGLGANALSDVAINKVFDIKKRDKNKPILIIAYNIDQVKDLIEDHPQLAICLEKAFWPGPLTIIFKASAHINEKLSGFENTIGIRIPDNKICLKLLQICKVPLTSTSANISGEMNSLNANDVINNLGDKLDVVIDGGDAKSNIPSTVLDLSEEMPIIRREGVIKKNEIEQIIGFKLNENK